MSGHFSMLGDVAEFINGAAFKPDDWAETGFRIIRIQNLTDPTKPFNRTTRTIPEILYVQPGDLLVSWSASLGVFEWQGPDVGVLNQHIFRVLPNERKIDKRYLRYALELALLDMQKHLHGATMMHVNRGEFLSTQLYLPPLPEQRRIAAILDKADAIRRKRCIAIKHTSDFLDAAFAELCGFEVKLTLLSDIADVITGFAFQSERYTNEPTDIRLIRGTNVGTGQFDWSETAFYSRAQTTSLEKFSIHSGDVLLAMDRPWISSGLKCCIANADVEGNLLVQRVARIRPHSGMDSEFIFRCLNSHQFIGHCRVTETTIPHISPRDLTSFPVPDIGNSQKERFGKLARQVREMTGRMSSHLAVANQAFNALSHRAFGGQLEGKLPWR